jgi:hypothetical protein
MNQYRNRPGCMTIWLVLLIIGGVIGLFRNLSGGANSAQMQQMFPNFSLPPWYIPYSIVSTLAQLGFAFALFQWKRWGYYGLCVVWVIGALAALPMMSQMAMAMATNPQFGGAMPGPQLANIMDIAVFVGVGINILITYLVIQPVWDQLE